MGPNSKRNQAAAQAARNTPSRARFSKGSPNKRPSSSGRGRGGGRGGSAGDADKKDDADDEIRK